MGKNSHNCYCCNKIVTDVYAGAEKCILFCEDCGEANKDKFAKKDVPYYSAKGYTWWSLNSYNDCLTEIKKESATAAFTEKCDHCNKALDQTSCPERYSNDLIWCPSCVKEEDTFLTSCGISHRVDSTAPSRWTYHRTTKLLKDYPQKGKTEDYAGLTCPCDHCGKDLPYKDIPDGYEAPWCKSCYTEDIQLLIDFDVPNGAFSKDREIQAWRMTAPKVKRIPKKAVMSELITDTKIESKTEEVKKTSEIVCQHCDGVIQEPPGEVLSDEVLWCNTCCVENEKFFVDNSLTRKPTNSSTHWRKWVSPTNTVTLRSFPKKSIKVEDVKKAEESKICCGHCSDEIIDAPVGSLREGEMIWCETCCTENTSFIEKLQGSGIPNSTNKWRRWEIAYNVAMLKAFPKKVEGVKPAVTIAAEATNTEVLRTEVTVLPADKIVACDHCSLSLNVGDMPDLTVYWCGNCCNTNKSLLDSKGAVFWTKADVEKSYATYPNAIKKDDGTIAYAGWKNLASKIQEIPKKGHKTADCHHCGKHLDVTDKPNYLVYWCNGCVDEEKTLLHNQGLSIDSGVNSTSQFHGWKDNAPFIQRVPKKIEVEKSLETCNCKNCDKVLERKSVWALNNQTDPFVWCKECIITNFEKTREQRILTLTSDFYEKNDKVFGEFFTSANEIDRLKVISNELKAPAEKKEEKPAAVETCECGSCGKSLDKKLIWDSRGTIPIKYVWCKECVQTNYTQLSAQNVSLLPRSSYEGNKYVGELFESSDAERIKKFLADQKELCSCGFCGKSLEKRNIYTIRKSFEFVLCKDCALTHKEPLAKKGVNTVGKDYYELKNHISGEEFYLPEEIEKLKTYIGAMKESATKKEDAVKEIHITTNCGHCAKSLDIVAAPNYDIYWCNDCVTEERELLHGQGIPIETCHGYTKNFIGWKDSASKVRAIGTKEDLAKARVLKAEAEAEAERIKSCTTNCHHCNKSIVFSLPVKSNTVEVAWCKECSLEDKAMLTAAGVLNNLCDQIWETNRPKVIAIPKKPNAVCGHCNKSIYVNGFNSEYNAVWCADCSNEDYEILKKAGIAADTGLLGNQLWSSSKSSVEAIQRKISCAHCGKRVYSADSGGRKSDSLVWCKDCSLSNADFLESKQIVRLTKNDYEKMEYDGEGWRDPSVIDILKKVPMTSEKNCTCDHCGATFHDASFEAGMVAWCKKCCGENANFLKEVGIPGFETEYSLEGKVWGLKKNVEKVKLIAKKNAIANSVCSHCGTSLYFRGTFGEHIAWCRNCYEKDFSILQALGETNCLEELVNARCWYPTQEAFAKVKAVSKANNTVCDHCDKKFFAQCIATAPDREYVSWCQDCCHTDAAMLKSGGTSSDGALAGINGYNWTQEDARKLVKDIEKKANSTCDHCEKKVRVKPEHLSSDAIYWCNDCAVLDEKELKKLNLPIRFGSPNKYHSWIVNAARVKSIAKKSAIVREISKQVELLTGQCPCHVCGKGTTDYNLTYRDPKRWYNTCHVCSVRINEIKNPGIDNSGISLNGSGSIQKEVDQEGHATNKAVKQVIEEFNTGKKILEDAAAKEAERLTKEIEEIAAKATARAAEIKAEIAKKEAEAIKRVNRLTEKLFLDKTIEKFEKVSELEKDISNMPPTAKTSCSCCGVFCPDWGIDPFGNKWVNACESCSLKIVTEHAKIHADFSASARLTGSINLHHGMGWGGTTYGEAIKLVTEQIKNEKEIAATITKMLEVVENTMAKIEAVDLPVEDIQKIIDSFDKAISLDQGTLDTMAKAVGSKSAPKLERLEVAKRIIDALSNDAYPFGGFVRDLYAFEDFKDIDLFFPRFDTEQYPANRFSGFEKCVLALKEKGFTLQECDEESPLYVEEHHIKLIKKSYLVTDTKTGISINIDLVRTNAGKVSSKYDTPFLALDADVNSLFFDKKTQMYKAANGYDTTKVIRNIENKVFDLANNGEVLTKRINKLTEKGYTPTKNMTIDKTVLKVGDLVSLLIKNPDSGANYLREATVFSTENGEVRAILSSPIDSTTGNSWVVSGSKDTAAVKKIGRTVGSELLGWSIDANTTVTALHGNVFPPPPALDYNLLNIGDKIEIEYSGVDSAGNKFSYLGNGVILDVGDMSKGIFPIATISANVVTNPISGATLGAGGNPSTAQLTLMQMYGIPATNVIRLETSLKATKVTGKMESIPIDQTTLNIGDKVELEINLRGSNFTRTDEKVTKTAWVVGITSGVRHFALESPAKSVDGSSTPCYYVPDYTEYHVEAKRLGVDCNARNGWKFNVDNTKIRKVLEKTPPLIDPLTVEVGDRCEVEVQPGRYGLATCIQKQTNGNPCWAFDKIPGMNVSSAGPAEIPLYQKYGVPGGSYTYWINDSTTKIRKNVGHVDHCFIEHKTLNVGDVFDVEIVYSGKSYGTVTAIIAEIDSNGRQLITLNKQIPGLSGVPSGVYTHAANVMGWDPALCGTWVLQGHTDKVSQKIETRDLNIRPFSEFKIGDLVEVEVLNNAVNFKTEALVGAVPQTGILSLILKNRSDVAMNCDANLKKVAEKYGFETESTMYNVNSGTAVIHKALGKANIKSLPPNSLKVGDRIEVCFGHEPTTTAVVIQSADESPYKEPIIAFESETNGCWPLDEKQKDLAFKYGITGKKVGRRVDGNTTFVTKVLGRKGFSAGNLKPGDRLKIGFAPIGSAWTPIPEGATVISSSGDTAVVVLDEVYRDLTGNVSNSKFATAAEKELAKKIGIDIADNDARIFAFSNSGVILIKDIESVDETQPDKQMSGSPPEEAINPASIQTGDRILMEIKEANGDEYEVEATALGVDYNGFPLVFLDEEMSKAFVFTQAANIKACEALGFDAKERRGWDLNPAKTKILEILDDKHEIEIEDVRIGDRIQVEFRDDDEVLFTKEGIYVGEDETSGLPVVYFTETISVGEEESWQAEKNTVPYLAVKKLGFTPDADQYMNLDYDIVIRKIVTRSKVELLQSDLEIEASDLQAEEPDEVEEEEEDDEYINPYTLSAGDKVEVKIVASQDEDSYITQMATVIDPDDVNGPLLALDEDFDLGEEETKPDSLKSLGKEVIKKAKQLGINPDKKVAWNVDDYTTIIKVLGKSINNRDADASQNKEENMPYDTDGEEITMLDMLKADALSAGYRVAANQMTKGVKGALILSMKDKGMDGGKIQAISEMLDTEMGEALISTLLGYGLTYIPGLGEDPRAQTLAEEFRINGIATAGNVIADSLFQHLLPAINSAMASLPPADEVLRLKKPARKRIATPKTEEKVLVEATGGEEPVKAATKRNSGASV